MTQSSAAITAREMRKSFGEHTVLDDVDLEVDQGTIFALLGPNGAGKTTIVRILSTLLKADGGTATVAGFDVATHPADVRASISLTGQFAAVDEILTGRENLILMARLRRVKDAGQIAGRPAGPLPAHRRGHSGGWRRTPEACAAASISP